MDLILKQRSSFVFPLDNMQSNSISEKVFVSDVAWRDTFTSWFEFLHLFLQFNGWLQVMKENIPNISLNIDVEPFTQALMPWPD